MQKAHALAHARRIEFDPFDRKSLDQTVPWIGRMSASPTVVGFPWDRLLGALCWVQKLGSWVFGSWIFILFLSKEIWQIDSISYIIHYSDSHWFQPNILLMEEILHHLGCTKPFKEWDKVLINWCRISSINSISCGCQMCHKFRWAHWFQ